jgi:hypothetical protein
MDQMTPRSLETYDCAQRAAIAAKQNAKWIPRDAGTAVVSGASSGIGSASLALSPSGEFLGFVGLDLERTDWSATRLNCIIWLGSASIHCRHCACGAIRRP